MTTPALSIYDIQCDGCHKWKHYKEEYNWKGGKRTLKCKECQGGKSEVEVEPTPSTKTKTGSRRKGKQAAPKRRVKNLKQLRHPDPIIAEIERISDLGPSEFEVRMAFHKGLITTPSDAEIYFEDRMDSPIAWYGMKKSIIDWTLSIIDWPENPHHLFVDGCGGSATVLLNRRKATAEIYNDRDGMLVNFFRINRDWPEELMRRLYLTPWSRDEFMSAAGRIIQWRNLEQSERDALLLPLDANPLPGNIELATMDAVLWSRSVAIASDFFTFINQGHSHKAKHVSWSMEYGIKNRKPEWWNGKVSSIIECASRVEGTGIENTNVLELIEKVNSHDTMLYLDPPYLLETRREGAAQSQYYHEMEENDHREMGALVQDYRGRVAIAGYRSDLYDNVLFPKSKGWYCFVRSARASDTKNSDGERTRVEAIWTNYDPFGYQQLPGFQG